MRRDKCLLAWSFRDLQAADVLASHECERTDDCPTYHEPHRITPRDNPIIREEIDKMLPAGIIKPANSSSPFPVVIETKRM